MNAPDEPSPVPDGMSAMLTISTRGSTSCASSASRTIGCSISAALLDPLQLAEYLRK